MARKLSESNIEQFVKGYLAKFRNVSEKRELRPFIQKAIKQLNFFLNVPCCLDPETTISFGRRDNALTTYINAILNNKMDKRKWRHSLERARDLLSNFIFDPCCPNHDIQGTIRVDALAGAGAIDAILLEEGIIVIGVPIFVSGDNLQITAGQTGQFTIEHNVWTIEVISSNIQAGLKWRIIDSNGTIQEQPYVGGNSQFFYNVNINHNGTWIIEIVPE